MYSFGSFWEGLTVWEAGGLSCWRGCVLLSFWERLVWGGDGGDWDGWKGVGREGEGEVEEVGERVGVAFWGVVAFRIRFGSKFF